MLLTILACHCPLDKTVQPFPYPPNYPHIKHISLQFTEKDVVGGHEKELTEAQMIFIAFLLFTDVIILSQKAEKYVFEDHHL